MDSKFTLGFCNLAKSASIAWFLVTKDVSWCKRGESVFFDFIPHKLLSDSSH